MKITAAMVDAGTAALARTRKQPDAAIVAAVYSAMAGRARVEATFDAKAPIPKKVPSYWPAWRYGPDGAKAIFNSAEEVPEGWADSPKKVKAPDPIERSLENSAVLARIIEKRGPGRPRKAA
jgi:hypothetical protein